MAVYGGEPRDTVHSSVEPVQHDLPVYTREEDSPETDASGECRGVLGKGFLALA